MNRMIKRFAVPAVLAALFGVLAILAWAVETNNKLDLSFIFTPETQLVVYVDDEWSDALSDSYGFGDTAEVTAPEVESKSFSHWEADGSVISYSNPLTLTMNANATLYAVYAKAAPKAQPAAGFTSVTRSDDGESISFQAIAAPADGGTVTGAGIVYSETASGDDGLKIGGAGVTNVAAEKITDSTEETPEDVPEMPKSVLDKNNCWMLRITPESGDGNSDTIYARAYMTVGENTIYGDIKSVNLSDLDGGVSMIANPDGFNPDPDNSENLMAILQEMDTHTVTFEPNGGVGSATTQAFFGDTVTLNPNTFTREGYVFRGWSTASDGEVEHEDGATVENLSNDILLYAVWEQGVAYKVTFKVANGSWNDETTADKTVTLFSKEGGALKLTADQIPAVGEKPNANYKEGSWSPALSTDTAITADTTYIYTYAAKGSVSRTVTFRVVNGSWNDGTTDDKTVTLNGQESDALKLTANQIPAVGEKPNANYKEGSWNVEPSTDAAITAATTYIYTYAAKDSVSRIVTFKVVNGLWNDETTADKKVTLNGLEGDTLKLSSEQIPAVGAKPGANFKAGSWDVTPSTDAAITADTTYIYIYAAKDSVTRTVTFKVVNGSWNDETTTDKKVTLKGSEGESLKLSAEQIPAVGTKPAATYKAGSWDVTPSTETAITADTTYTYTYTKKSEISVAVTFKVVNGAWNDGETNDKTVTLTGYEGESLKLTADQIPAVGEKPNANYKAGSWNPALSTDTAITADTTYTYSYAQKSEISAAVTFKVVNGAWNDGETNDKTVTLTGYEGDTLKLSAEQIPAVGAKPGANYKAGSWNVEPSTDAAITAATTYIYTYAAKDSVSKTVTFKVVNGSWNDETTADKKVTLNGLEGESLKLSAEQIPAVGAKPGANFKEGSWDVTPSTDAAITADTTYIYIYAVAPTPTPTNTPTPTPTNTPTPTPTNTPTPTPTNTPKPTTTPTARPTVTVRPTTRPTGTVTPTTRPTGTVRPTTRPTGTVRPTTRPTGTVTPTTKPTDAPTTTPTVTPTVTPTTKPTGTVTPTAKPTDAPTTTPTVTPTNTPTPLMPTPRSGGGRTRTPPSTSAGTSMSIPTSAPSVTPTPTATLTAVPTSTPTPAYSSENPAPPDRTGVADLLITDTHPAYIHGFEDGTFRPNDNISRAQTAVLFYRMLKNPNIPRRTSFNDMTGNEWYAEAVYALSGMGIIQGYEDGAFHGDDTISRAAFTAVAARFARTASPTISDDNADFSDVPKNDWAWDSIAKAASYGWIGGYEDGSFRPFDPITRAAAVAVINRMLGRSPDAAYITAHRYSLKRFSDVNDPNAWYYYNIAEAVNDHDFTLSDGKEIWR